MTKRLITFYPGFRVRELPPGGTKQERSRSFGSPRFDRQLIRIQFLGRKFFNTMSRLHKNREYFADVDWTVGKVREESIFVKKDEIKKGKPKPTHVYPQSNFFHLHRFQVVFLGQ